MLSVIDEALRARGLTDAEASRLAVGKDHLIKNLRHPRGAQARPNFAAIEALANVLGLELYFGPPRDPVPAPAIEGELTFLPRYDVAASAGAGCLGHDAEPVSHIAFRTTWLRSEGLVAREAALIDVRGDSMEPELHDGDLVLLDLRKLEPRPDQIWVFRDTDDTLRVKRLASRHETLYFLSTNADHPVEARTGPDRDRIHIIGRVAWFARTMR